MAKITQEELLEIFDTVKQLLKPYEKGTIVARKDLQGRYELWSEKEVEVGGKKRNEIYFAGLIVQTNYVGFYFMPVYTDVAIREVFQPELLNCLKGKSCFHIKTTDKNLMAQIKYALKKGYEEYKQKSWV